MSKTGKGPNDKRIKDKKRKKVGTNAVTTNIIE